MASGGVKSRMDAQERSSTVAHLLSKYQAPGSIPILAKQTNDSHTQYYFPLHFFINVLHSEYLSVYL